MRVVGVDSVGLPPIDRTTVTNSVLWGNSADQAGSQLSVGLDEAPLPLPPGIQLTVTKSDVEGGFGMVHNEGFVDPVWTSNIDADPLFIDAQAENYRTEIVSPVRNAGNDGVVPSDANDVDDDGVDDEDIPDLDLVKRIQVVVDLGGYEACGWDFHPEPGGNGGISFGDLTQVLLHWGPCPPSPAGCPWDVAPAGAPDGVVGFAEVTEMLLRWGCCPDWTPVEGGGCIEGFAGPMMMMSSTAAGGEETGAGPGFNAALELFAADGTFTETEIAVLGALLQPGF